MSDALTFTVPVTESPAVEVPKITTEELETMKTLTGAELEAAQRDIVARASAVEDDPWAFAKFKAAATGTLQMPVGMFDAALKAFKRSARKAAMSVEDQARAAKIEKASKGLWYDSQKNYYRQLEGGDWDPMSVEQTRRHLKVDCSLSDEPSGANNISEVDEALHYIETKQRVTGALPFPLRKESLVTWNGKKYLNIATDKLLEAADGTTAGWGDHFPWFAEFIERLFPDSKNRDIVLAWMRVWYKRVAETGGGGRGQALFIVGPVKTGKTFFSNCVLGRIFGSVADASSYFVEGNRFNAAMFDSVVWALDDSTILGDKTAHQKFSGLVKKSVANPSFPYDRKYGYTGSVPFCGRFICTMNDGPVAIEILPDTDQDLLDKVILVRTGSEKARMATEEAERYATLDRELPFFLRWLLQTDHAGWIGRGDQRCGIDAWHDKWGLDEARASATSATVMELVEIWRRERGKNPNKEDGKTAKDGKSWTGSATELLTDLQLLDQTKGHVRFLTPKSLGRNIASAIENGYKHAVKNPRSDTRRTITLLFDPTP